MTRNVVVAAAQLGPVSRHEPRSAVVTRMIALMSEAKERGAELVVFPELALTTFFPRWLFDDQSDVDAFFERAMPGADTDPLFETAAKLGLGFYLGYAELVRENARTRHFNTSILVDKGGKIVGKYRKVHLPGHAENEPWRPFQHLEKRYFEPGDLGFPVFQTFGGTLGMCICNDRRWPETFRVLGLQGVELVMLGYNTPLHYPPAPEHDYLQDFHNHLAMQAGAYQNGTWVVGVAKAGKEEGCDLIGGTCIIAPTGEIVAECVTLGDEDIRRIAWCVQVLMGDDEEKLSRYEEALDAIKNTQPEPRKGGPSCATCKKMIGAAKAVRR
jgi:predicted amidohydrolase